MQIQAGKYIYATDPTAALGRNKKGAYSNRIKVAPVRSSRGLGFRDTTGDAIIKGGQSSRTNFKKMEEIVKDIV